MSDAETDERGRPTRKRRIGLRLQALVDIISMVKHAADEQQSLLTAEEHVARAIAQTTARQRFTDEQRAWLGRMRSHLIENLSIGREDPEDLPVFSRFGGWSQANREFSGELADLVVSLNRLVAA